MEIVSIIIPSRNERFLDKTIDDIYKKTRGAVEIIVNLDGYKPEYKPGVRYIYNPEPIGMRPGINKAVKMARGKYIMKLDAHCMLDDGFDLKLIKAHKDNWVQIPTRKRLDPHKWKIDKTKPDINYMYLNGDMVGVACRNQNISNKMLDDTETFQGSCYFMLNDYFNKLNLMDDTMFGTFKHEAQEICLKVWKDGGRIIRNKNTWYAHPRLGKFYSLNESEKQKGADAIIKLSQEYGYTKRH